MHFNIYIDDETGKQLTKLAKQCKKTRNSLIREALKVWLSKESKSAWPKEFLGFQGVKDVSAFESYRKDLTPPSEDPFE